MTEAVLQAIDVEPILENLTDEEKTLFEGLAHQGKSTSRYFYLENLERSMRKRLNGINLDEVMKGLWRKGLAQPVDHGKRLWTLTREGKAAEHEWFKRSFLAKNPGIALSIR